MATTGARSPQMSQQQAGGAFAYADIRRHPADVWFVDSTNTTRGADTVGHGQNPDEPFLTLHYANTQATDSVGDVIYLMPGHVETVVDAGELVLDCIGLTVRGLGEGALQPMIEVTTEVLADIDIDAASITIEDVHFQAGVQDIVAMIDVNATDFTLRRCRFSQGAVDENALITIQDAAGATSDRITIEYCEAIMYDSDNTHFVNFAGTGAEHVIRNNVLLGDWGTVVVGGAGILVSWSVNDNQIHNVPAVADSGIATAATSTGMIMNNRIGIGHAAGATTGLDADLCAMCENYVVDWVGAAQGILDPGV